MRPVRNFRQLLLIILHRSCCIIYLLFYISAPVMYLEHLFVSSSCADTSAARDRRAFLTMVTAHNSLRQALDHIK